MFDCEVPLLNFFELSDTRFTNKHQNCKLCQASPFKSLPARTETTLSSKQPKDPIIGSEVMAI